MRNACKAELRDVVGIGNAIVDILTHADDAFLVDRGIVKGAMTLAEESQAASLYEAVNHTVEMSGGSVGNTMAGIAARGGTASYIGKVCNDKLGEAFRHDLEAMAINFKTPPAVGGPPTARCFVIITPDGQRSMVTYLGACVGLSTDDIDKDIICRHKIVYLEGYLWDSPSAKEALVKAAALAHEGGRKVALTLSDSFCVDRHRESFHDFIEEYTDILFANEAEINSLYQVEGFDTALAQARQGCDLVFLTRSEKGSVIISGDELHIIPAMPVTRVVDVTGAGDLYAAGVLYGLVNDRDLATCGRIGSIAAAEIISHVGARPEI